MMVKKDEYAAYQAKNLEALKKLLDETNSRPVFFLGSGITKRFLGGPSWMELLQQISKTAGISDSDFAFLSQKAGNNPAQLGTLLVDKVHDWAWQSGKKSFPAAYFEVGTEKSLFIKYLAAEILKKLTLKPKNPLSNEIELLKKSVPHAIITTNFDTLIEQLFPDFVMVLGERIIPMSMNITGEIYKIHGSVSDPQSLVLTKEDYDRFGIKRRYISSKMMTYFAEYPVIIMGYGLGDANVNSIISDLGEAMREKGGLLDNVYYVQWVQDVLAEQHLKEEHVVPSEVGAALRVRTIVTSDFDWILKGIADFGSPVPVNMRVLRHLATRVVDMVRVDAPKHKVEIDYEKIENLSDDQSKLGLLLGISNISNPNVDFPYVLSQVAEKLGYSYWGKINKFLPFANEKAGIEIKKSDNDFHFAYKSGKTNAVTHKYSEKFVNLLRDVIAENPL